MPKVELSLALSSRGRSILRTSLDEHLTAQLLELLSTKMIRTPGTYSVSLGKAWVFDGEATSEISVILSYRLEPPLSSAKRAAVAAAFA